MIEVEIAGIRMEMPSQQPVVALRALDPNDLVLSILIGSQEATAIAFALEGVQTPRPMTHDLLVLTLSATGFLVSHVVISQIVEGTFYADLHLSNPQTGFSPIVSCRPSDALALASRVECAIYVAEEVFEVAGVVEGHADEGDEVLRGDPPEEVVEEFRQFIDQVNPEDFAS